MASLERQTCILVFRGGRGRGEQLGEYWDNYNRTTIKKIKKYITRDTEIKNKWTVTGGEVGGYNRGKGGGVVRNMYKGHMDKIKGVRSEGGRLG